jgi:hypothetical protein
MKLKLNTEEILKHANLLYASKKLKMMGKIPNDIRYMAPEQIPSIQSDQVIAILEALVQSINEQNGMLSEIS